MSVKESALEFFGLTKRATIEDIKNRYRVLVKRYHPDMTKKDTADKFIQLQSQYEWLLNNHKPELPPKKPITTGDATIYYRVLAEFVAGVDVNESGYTIRVPEKIFAKKTIIYCILGLEEFRLVFDAGTELPIKGQITNIKGSAFIHIKPEEYLSSWKK